MVSIFSKQIIEASAKVHKRDYVCFLDEGNLRDAALKSLQFFNAKLSIIELDLSERRPDFTAVRTARAEALEALCSAARCYAEDGKIDKANQVLDEHSGLFYGNAAAAVEICKAYKAAGNGAKFHFWRRHAYRLAANQSYGYGEYYAVMELYRQ